MTAEDIRHQTKETIETVRISGGGDAAAITGGLLGLIAFLLGEIAAQLAELNNWPG